jgi:hypothetical protein
MRPTLRELAPVVLASIGARFLAATLDPGGLLLVFAGLVLAIAGMLVRFRTGWGSAPAYPAATFLIAVGVLSVAWIGIRGPAEVPVSDLPLLAAMPVVALALLRREAVLPLPAWLLCVAGGLAIAALLAALFVTEPPPRVLSERSAATLGAAASRATDFALLMRIEYALVLVPVVIGVVADSPARARLFADLWLASATISAAVGCLDRLAGTGITDSLVGPLEGAPVGDRATGLTFHPNYLGLFAAMALPLGIVRITQTSGLGRLSTTTATGILTLGVQLSGSRLALVAALVGVGLLMFLIPRFRSRIALGFLACAAVAVVFLVAAPTGQTALERLSGDPSAEAATRERQAIIEEGLEVGLEHPLTGVGFDRILDSHSVPVQFFQAGGIVALASLALWALGMGRLGWALSRSPVLPPRSAQLAAALVSGLSGWLLTSLLAPQLAERFMYVPAGVLLGLSLVASRYKPAPQASRGEIEPERTLLAPRVGPSAERQRLTRDRP